MGFWSGVRAHKREAQRLAKHIYPVLGNLIIQDIGPREVVAAFLTPTIQELAADSISRISSTTKRIFDYATRQGLIEMSPMQMPLYNAMLKAAPKPKKEAGHNGALLPEEVPEFIHSLILYALSAKAAGRFVVPSFCLLFAILTNARSTNAREARWKEFDFKAGVRVIPKERMKESKNGDHTVFLPSQLIELVESMPRITGNPYVFASNHGGALSDGTFASTIKALNKARVEQGLAPFVDKRQKDSDGQGRKITQHGVARASFRTWSQKAVDTEGRRIVEAVAELTLHHAYKGAGGLGRAYEREEFLEERRALAQQWTAFYTY